MNNVELLEYFLSKGANPSIQNNNGITPLMLWCVENWTDAVKLVFRYYPDIDLELKDRWGKRTIDYCHNDSEIKKIIQERMG